MGKKKPFRRSDGRPEMRSVEQMMREAVPQDEYENLPGKGKPLDLREYFGAGETNRVAHRLLKDNKVLPQHLQERRDAEDALHGAEEALERQVAALEELRERIHREAETVSAGLPDDRSRDQVTGLIPWPFESRTSPPHPVDHRTLSAALQALADLLGVYHQRRETALGDYRDTLNRANTASDRYHRQIAATGALMPAYPPPPRADVETCLERARARIPELARIPSGSGARLRACRRAARPSLWTRLSRRGSR